jgi:hypothetical protein
LLYKNGTIDWELLYVNNFEGTLSRLGQFTQIWIANVTTDENFVIDAEFMRNAFSVFGIGGGLRLSLFAIVDGMPIGGKGSWKNHVAVECKLSGLAFKVVWNVVLMAHITGMRSSCWADMVSRS